MIQLSILKIAGYGPWTLTRGSDREHELQMLQASLYGELQRLFSERNCLVFLNRADEFFAVSNGLGLDDHVEIQKSLEGSFDIRLSVSIGCGASPFEANQSAYEGRKNGAVLNEEHSIFGSVGGSPGPVSIMHLDVDDLTSIGDTASPYEISSTIFGLYHRMAEFFLEKKSLAFFMGGDNFMVVADGDAKNSAHDFINMIRGDSGISLNCGIGTGHSAREAAMLATKSLDAIRRIRDSGEAKPDVYELPC